MNSDAAASWVWNTRETNVSRIVELVCKCVAVCQCVVGLPSSSVTTNHLRSVSSFLFDGLETLSMWQVFTLGLMFSLKRSERLVELSRQSWHWRWSLLPSAGSQWRCSLKSLSSADSLYLQLLFPLTDLIKSLSLICKNVLFIAHQFFFFLTGSNLIWLKNQNLQAHKVFSTSQIGNFFHQIIKFI